jgi:septal ring factor EnvC (AmiA/AmiB activator)
MDENLPKDWLTAAQVISGLQKALDRANDKIEDLEDFQDRVRRSDGQLKSEFDRQIAQHERAYSQCETYLLNTRVQLDAKADALEDAMKQIRNYEVVVATQSEGIDRLLKQVKELEDNPPIVLDSVSTGIITDLQEQVRQLNLQVEGYEYNLRSIRNNVERHTKVV